MKDLKFAIIGAGAGGQSMAAILTQEGYRVRLYDIDSAKIERLNELDVIRITGAIEAEAKPEVITTDIAVAMDGADVIMVVTTTDGHADVAEKISPYLRDGQIILLNPGHVGGALEVSAIIRESGCKADLIIGEAGDLMYACRVMEVGHIFHSGIKKRTAVATLPAKDVNRLLEVLQPIFPMLVAADNVLYTGLVSGGAMLHPIPTLMNVNKIDLNQPFDYYMEGITPSVAKLIEVADEERLAVCKALRVEIPSLVKNLQRIYGLTQDDLYELLQNNEPYRGLKPPRDLSHRFVVEDIMSGLVPIASLGDQLGVPTPMIDAFIEIGSVAAGRDFRVEGRTVEKLGLAGKTVEEIHDYISYTLLL